MLHFCNVNPINTLDQTCWVQKAEFDTNFYFQLHEFVMKGWEGV